VGNYLLILSKDILKMLSSYIFRFKKALVFVLTIIWLVYSGITLVFKFQAVWTTFYHTHFRFIRTKLMQISMFFADWLVYSRMTLVFKFQAVWTTSSHTQFRFIRTKYQGEFSLLNNIDRNKKNRNIILKSRKKVNLNLLH
jgi:hypothetical protein